MNLSEDDEECWERGIGSTNDGFVNVAADIVPEFIRERLETVSTIIRIDKPGELVSKKVEQDIKQPSPKNDVIDLTKNSDDAAQKPKNVLKRKADDRGNGISGGMYGIDSPAKKLTKPRRTRKKKCDTGLTKTQIKHQKEDEEYQSRIRPAIDIDMYPMVWDVSSGESRRVWEFGIGCKGYAPFAGAPYESFGGNICGHIELLNNLNWGFKDGATAIVVATGTSVDCIADIGPILVTRESGGFRDPPRVLAATTSLTTGKSIEGTIGVSRGGWIIDFAVTHDRYTRETRPLSVPYARIRTAETLRSVSELHIVAVFDGPTDAEEWFPFSKTVARDTTFPIEHRGVNETLYKFATGTFQEFVDTVASICSATSDTNQTQRSAHILAVLLSDPRVYGVASPVKYFSSSVLLGTRNNKSVCMKNVCDPLTTSCRQQMSGTLITLLPSVENAVKIAVDKPRSLMRFVSKCATEINDSVLSWIRSVIMFYIHLHEEKDVSDCAGRGENPAEILLECLKTSPMNPLVGKSLEEFLRCSAFSWDMLYRKKAQK